MARTPSSTTSTRRFPRITSYNVCYTKLLRNPDGAAVLAQELRRRQVSGRTRLVLGMLRDKETAGFASQLVDCVDDWYAVTLPAPRGLAAQELASYNFV